MYLFHILVSYPSKIFLDVQFINNFLIVLFYSSLEELHLSFNQIEISTEEKSNGRDDKFPKIKVLHFDGNRVENRDHLEWLSTKFPTLNSLVLCDCPLWTLRWKSPAAREAQVNFFPISIVAFLCIPFFKHLQSKSMSESSSGSCSGSAESSSFTASCSGDGKTSSCCVPSFEQDRTEYTKTSINESDLFPHLRSISLNNSMFDCWEEISQLRIWPSLAELRMQSCPLFRV